MHLFVQIWYVGGCMVQSSYNHSSRSILYLDIVSRKPVFWMYSQVSLYLIKMPYNAFANRADPDQAALVSLWKYGLNLH